MMHRQFTYRSNSSRAADRPSAGLDGERHSAVKVGDALVSAMVAHADGFGEHRAALSTIGTVPGAGPKTLGGEKGYDTVGFVEACRQAGMTPRVAMNTVRSGGSAIDGRTPHHAGHQVNQKIRKRIEEHFGWAKTVGRPRQTVVRGVHRVDQHFKLTMLASNIVRMSRIRYSQITT